jgi:hypothetical protein
VEQDQRRPAARFPGEVPGQVAEQFRCHTRKA